MPKEIPDSTLISSGFDAGLDGWAVYNTGTLSNDNGRLKFSGSQVWSSLKKDLQLKTSKQYRVRFTIDMGNCTELHFPIYKSDISSYETLTGVGLSITASGTYEGTFTATSNSMFLLFEMIPGVNPPPDSTGYYWIDDVSVEEIKAGDTTHVGKEGYRYGFNGQEKSGEINGNGNLYTADFWEYDSRIGRRWNMDPKQNISLSPYNSFADNPILFSDRLGDTTSYSVQKGDNLTTIAKQHNLSLDRLKQYNPQINDYNKIQIGDNINIPGVQNDKLINGTFVAVVNAPEGAKNNGHNAIMVGNDKTGWTLISKEGRNGGSWEGSNNNIISGGPAKSVLRARFGTMQDLFESQSIDGYGRAAIFSVQNFQAETALTIMNKEAASKYSVLMNNCAHAAGNTIQAIGLDPGWSKVTQKDRWGHTFELWNMSPIPNIQYQNIIFNNRNKLITTVKSR